MFEQLEQRWRQEKESRLRWTIYRGWMGAALGLLIVMVLWLEKGAR
jgi:hypothetical protein